MRMPAGAVKKTSPGHGWGRDRLKRKYPAKTTKYPITRTIRGVDTEVILEPADGVPATCAVTLDNIFTIQRAALDDVITALSRNKLLLIFAAIRRAFDMP